MKNKRNLKILISIIVFSIVSFVICFSPFRLFTAKGNWYVSNYPNEPRFGIKWSPFQRNINKKNLVIDICLDSYGSEDPTNIIINLYDYNFDKLLSLTPNIHSDCSYVDHNSFNNHVFPTYNDFPIKESLFLNRIFSLDYKDKIYLELVYESNFNSSYILSWTYKQANLNGKLSSFNKEHSKTHGIN